MAPDERLNSRVFDVDFGGDERDLLVGEIETTSRPNVSIDASIVSNSEGMTG